MVAADKECALGIARNEARAFHGPQANKTVFNMIYIHARRSNEVMRPRIKPAGLLGDGGDEAVYLPRLGAIWFKSDNRTGVNIAQQCNVDLTLETLKAKLAGAGLNHH